MSADKGRKKIERKAGRRPRNPLSCELCRSRKLKCNREQPCQNCIVRTNSAGCVYLRSDPSSTGPRPVHVDGMRERIDRLEALISSMVAQNSGRDKPIPSIEHDDSVQPLPEEVTPPGSEDSQATEDATSRIGVLKIDENISVYRGTIHWYDLVQELNELKSFWNQFEESQAVTVQTSSLHEFDAPSFLTGILRPVSVQEVLSTIPPKSTTDKLMVRFFDGEASLVPAFHILHQPTFMQQYESHWANPSETKIMWLGLFFSMLSLTMISYHLNNDEPPEYEGISVSLSELYRVRTAQCLMMADISKGAAYTCETLIYHAMAEWTHNSEREKRVWMMVGLLVRVAFQMGYHRDPSQYPDISIFQGEIRRRVWCFIRGLDSLTSLHVGLPSMVRSMDYDTVNPRSLHDWELNEEMEILPPSRPDSETTPITYMISKSRLLSVAGKVIEYLGALEQHSYDNILKLDRELSDAFNSLPSYLKGFTLDAPTSLAHRRLQLNFLNNQTVCILHRRYFAKGRVDNRYARSYIRCIESAVALLGLQNYIYNQSKIVLPDGIRSWYFVSQTSQDFVLAAMILCLDLRHRKNEKVTLAGRLESIPQTDILDALQAALRIWEEGKDTNPEALKVYHVLSKVIGTLGVDDEKRTPRAQDAAVALEQVPPQLPSYDDGQTELPEIGMEIDWAVMDSFIEGANFEDIFGGLS